MLTPTSRCRAPGSEDTPRPRRRHSHPPLAGAKIWQQLSKSKNAHPFWISKNFPLEIGTHVQTRVRGVTVCRLLRKAGDRAQRSTWGPGLFPSGKGVGVWDPLHAQHAVQNKLFSEGLDSLGKRKLEDKSTEEGSPGLLPCHLCFLDSCCSRNSLNLSQKKSQTQRGSRTIRRETRSLHGRAHSRAQEHCPLCLSPNNSWLSSRCPTGGGFPLQFLTNP